MPLAEPVDTAWVDSWKEGKSQLWGDPERGPWGVFIEHQFAGWAGLQPDDGDSAELAVVLNVWAWRMGNQVANAALEKWLSLGGTSTVYVYFPFSRPVDLIKKRFALEFVTEVEWEGTKFARLRLTKLNFD